ncbi:hypothetical protein AB6A40_011375 [Gnathostoma spinigerum]|uniref:Uncharacterized protein n=1 Tax=Gnathostoma spinigerum TaxID=75299 RepID=A0ABD6EXM8_9BILA
MTFSCDIECDLSGKPVRTSGIVSIIIDRQSMEHNSTASTTMFPDVIKWQRLYVMTPFRMTMVIVVGVLVLLLFNFIILSFYVSFKKKKLSNQILKPTRPLTTLHAFNPT